MDPPARRKPNGNLMCHLVSTYLLSSRVPRHAFLLTRLCSLRPRRRIVLRCRISRRSNKSVHAPWNATPTPYIHFLSHHVRCLSTEYLSQACDVRLVLGAYMGFVLSYVRPSSRIRSEHTAWMSRFSTSPRRRRAHLGGAMKGTWRNW